jgi:hypothetical protein
LRSADRVAAANRPSLTFEPEGWRMNLVNRREPLASALSQARGKLRQANPDRDDAVILDVAATQLLGALRGGDLKATGLRLRRDRKERYFGPGGLAKIPMEFWYHFDRAGPFVEAIQGDLLDPWSEGEDGSVY